MKKSEFSPEYEYIPTQSSGGCFYARMIKFPTPTTAGDDWATTEPFPHGPDTEFEPYPDHLKRR